MAAGEMNIIILNKLVKEKRDIHVYHHFKKSGHIISSNSSLKLGIQPEAANDYLHISVQRGPGHVENFCVLDLPAFVDFRFSNIGEILFIHSGERFILRIPPGPPLWEMKVKIPARSPLFTLSDEGHVTIGDENEWPGYVFEDE
ncbi:MAG: hypothetical protein MUF15_17465 [Acidobacteria bacterium]|jgi:hypothetical protein|nr:hypothetical protein [Acidobacteriota bacterium]